MFGYVDIPRVSLRNNKGHRKFLVRPKSSWMIFCLANVLLLLFIALVRNVKTRHKCSAQQRQFLNDLLKCFPGKISEILFLVELCRLVMKKYTLQQKIHIIKCCIGCILHIRYVMESESMKD